MGGQDDGDAGFAQLADQLPHVAAQLHVHASGRLVQKQHARLMAQRLGDHHTALHAARQFQYLGVALVPQRQVAQYFLDMGGIARLAEQSPAERHRVDYPLELVGGQFLRHQPDGRARAAIVAHNVMPGHLHAAAARPRNAADDGDHRRLARAVRPQQRENLAFLDGQVDAIERLEARRIGFGQAFNFNDGCHGWLCPFCVAAKIGSRLPNATYLPPSMRRGA